MVIPAYVVVTISLPIKIFHEIDSIIRNFWWGKSNAKKGLVLKSWKSCYWPKDVGGLGFRRMEVVNRVFLAKWGWKILNEEPSLWLELVRSKYLKGQNFLMVDARPTNSRIWKVVCRQGAPVYKPYLNKLTSKVASKGRSHRDLCKNTN